MGAERDHLNHLYIIFISSHFVKTLLTFFAAHDSLHVAAVESLEWTASRYGADDEAMIVATSSWIVTAGMVAFLALIVSKLATELFLPAMGWKSITLLSQRKSMLIAQVIIWVTLGLILLFAILKVK